MEGITGTTRLEISSNLIPGENPSVSPEFPRFVVHDKPPPSYEESQQQQQHNTFGNEVNEVSQADKLAIYRHPLFPLLAMLFDKCEWATGSQEGPSSQAFQNDIRSFLLHIGQDGKSLMSGNDETDSLMVKAILVLKIHLLEIEKVNELCKDFCQRYIACLKGKLQTENMLGIFSSGCDSVMSGISNDTSIQLNQLQGMSSLAFFSQSTPSNNNTSQVVTTDHLRHPVPSLPTMALGTSSDQNTSVTTSSVSNNMFGSSFPALDAQYKSPVSGTSNQSLRTVPLASLSPSPPRKQSRRSILPKHATNTMKAWLFQHIAHPYPSEEEKRILAHQTDLSLLQVNNWFINARRRILQPMLESSNPENTFRSKKAKPNQARLAQRFWPESLVQTIQGGSNAMQYPQQTVHIISSDLKDGVPIAVVSNTNPLVSTGIPIQCVQSEKLPILTMLACPTQTINQAELMTVANENNSNTGNNIVPSGNNNSILEVSLETNSVIPNPDKSNVDTSGQELSTPGSDIQTTSIPPHI